MIANIRANKPLQFTIAVIAGFMFGFLLQKGGVTQYDVIIGQLLLKDFTVVKIMLSAVVVGMIGIYIMKGFKIVSLHPKPGSIATSVIGGLIFGLGFAVLGYCPGTVAGAVGRGSMDALFGGVAGILAGTVLFAGMYKKLYGFLFNKQFDKLTLPEMLKVNEWVIIVPLSLIIIWLLIIIERAGL